MCAKKTEGEEYLNEFFSSQILGTQFLMQYDNFPYSNRGNKRERKEEMSLGDKGVLQIFEFLPNKHFKWICSLFPTTNNKQIKDPD